MLVLGAGCEVLGASCVPGAMCVVGPAMGEKYSLVGRVHYPGAPD